MLVEQQQFHCEFESLGEFEIATLLCTQEYKTLELDLLVVWLPNRCTAVCWIHLSENRKGSNLV